MAIDNVFYAELALVCTSCLLLWPPYLAQLLRFRFTQSVHRDRMRGRMLLLCAGALVLQSARACDPSGVFGLLGSWSLHALLQQCTCFVLFAAIALSQGAAEALYTLLQRPPPVWLAPIMWAAVAAYQAATLVYLAIEAWLHYWSDYGDVELARQISVNSQARGVLFMTVMFFLLILWFVFFFGLYPPMCRILGMLERKDVARRAELMALRTASTKKTVTNSLGTPGNLEMAPYMQASPIDLSFSPETSESHSLAPPSAGSSAGSTPSSSDSIPSPSRSRMLVSFAPGQHKSNNTLALPPSSHSSDSAAASASAVAKANENARILVAQVSIAAQTSRLPRRLMEMRQAVSRFRWMTLAVTIVCLASIGGAVQRVLELMAGENEALATPHYYQLSLAFTTIVQQISIVVAIWYCWQDTSIWSDAATRRHNGTPFWRTLFTGPEADSLIAAGDVHSVTHSSSTDPTKGGRLQNGASRILRPNVKRSARSRDFDHGLPGGTGNNGGVDRRDDNSSVVSPILDDDREQDSSPSPPPTLPSGLVWSDPLAAMLRASAWPTRTFHPFRVEEEPEFEPSASASACAHRHTDTTPQLRPVLIQHTEIEDIA